MGTGEKTIVIQILDDKDATSADELDDHILCLEAARGHLEVEWTETLGALNARELHKVFGYPSAIAYLKHRCRMAGGRARRYVSMARLARRFHSTFLSWKYGQISTDQAHQLFRAAEQMPDKYPDAEPVLLEIVGDTPEETGGSSTIGDTPSTRRVWSSPKNSSWDVAVSMSPGRPTGW